MYIDNDKQNREELLHKLIEIHIALMNRFNQLTGYSIERYESFGELIRDITDFADRNSKWPQMQISKGKLKMLKQVRNKLSHPFVLQNFVITENYKGTINNIYFKMV